MTSNRIWLDERIGEISNQVDALVEEVLEAPERFRLDGTTLDALIEMVLASGVLDSASEMDELRELRARCD